MTTSSIQTRQNLIFLRMANFIASSLNGLQEITMSPENRIEKLMKEENGVHVVIISMFIHIIFSKIAKY